MNILHIDSSILGSHSATRTLSKEVVAKLKAANPTAKVQYEDLTVRALPHFSGVSLAQSDATEATRNATILTDFLAADVIVVGAPMYNFSIPSQLKAWIDRILIAGKTFRYTEKGPEGLAKGKKVIVAIARGGFYEPGSPAEFAETYLKHIFGFIGITDVSFVRADGLAISPEQREKSIGAALQTIHTPVAVAA